MNLLNSIPILNSNHLFARNGSAIAALNLYDKNTYELDEAKYAEAAPIYITTYFASTYSNQRLVSYFASFMSIAAAVTHVILWHGHEIKHQVYNAFRQMEDTSTDIHNRLMASYPDIPEWMFLVFLSIMIIMQW